MNETQIKETVARVLELDGLATKGPWACQLGKANRVVAVQAPTGPDVARCSLQLDPRTDCDNAALIAYYRTAAPALAREVKRLTAELEKLKAERDEARRDGERLTWLLDYITQHGANGLTEILWTVVEEDEGDAMLDRADLVFDRAAIDAALKEQP